MLWIAVYLPELPLQLASRAVEEDVALVVAAGPSNRPVVVCTNTRAQQLGIQRGATIASARALANPLHVCNRDESAEAAAIHNLACWACQFTPSVSVRATQGVLLEVSTTLKLHGGYPKLRDQVRRGLQSLGYIASIGSAATPLAAWLLAKAARDDGAQSPTDLEVALAPIPLSFLDWPEGRLQKLRALGVFHIAQFLRLPPEGVAQRFGADAWCDVQRALGRLPDPQATFVLPETFRAHLEFGFEVADAMMLLFPLRRLLAEMEGFLRGRGAGVVNFRIELECASRGRAQVTIGVGRPERQADRFLSLAREHLQRLALPGGVLRMIVIADNLHDFAEESASWLPDPRHQEGNWHQLLDKLIARVGQDNVYRLQAVDDFRPEDAWRAVSPGAPWKRRDPVTVNWPRPLFLLPAPRKLHVDQGAPLCHGKVNLSAGPERIEYGWWDGKPALRDYYVGRNAHGETMWLYRDLADPGSWHLHGYFS
jgi:protein ImuB